MRQFIYVILCFAVLFVPAGASRAQTLALAPGDAVELTVYGREDLNIERVIDPDGNVLVPLLGRIQATGRSPQELEAEVSESLEARGLMDSPSVQVSVVRWRDVFVLGDVADPGAYGWRAGLTIEQAAALAGGEGSLPQDQFGTLLQAYTTLERAQALRRSTTTLRTEQVRLEAEIAFIDSVFGSDGTPSTGAAAMLDWNKLFPQGGAAPEVLDSAAFRDLQVQAGELPLIVFPAALAQDPALADLRNVQQSLLRSRIDLLLSTRDAQLLEQDSLTDKIVVLSEQQTILDDTIAQAQTRLDRLSTLKDSGLVRIQQIENFQTSLSALLTARLDLLAELTDTRIALELRELDSRNFASRARGQLSDRLEEVLAQLTEAESRRLAARRSAQVAQRYLDQEGGSITSGVADTLIVYEITRVQDGTATVTEAGPKTLLLPGDTVTLRLIDDF